MGGNARGLSSEMRPKCDHFINLVNLVACGPSPQMRTLMETLDHAQAKRRGKKPTFSYRCWMNISSEVKLYNCRVGADITNAAYLFFLPPQTILKLYTAQLSSDFVFFCTHIFARG